MTKKFFVRASILYIAVYAFFSVGQVWAADCKTVVENSNGEAVKVTIEGYTSPNFAEEMGLHERYGIVRTRHMLDPAKGPHSILSITRMIGKYDLEQWNQLFHQPIVDTSFATEGQKNWDPNFFSNPKEYDPDDFVFVLHSTRQDSGAAASFEHLMTPYDLKYAYMFSDSEGSHFSSKGSFGFVLKIPSSLVVSTSSFDVGSRAQRVSEEFKEEFYERKSLQSTAEIAHRELGISNPRVLLDQMKDTRLNGFTGLDGKQYGPGRDNSEIIFLPSGTTSGETVEVIGVFWGWSEENNESELKNYGGSIRDKFGGNYIDDMNNWARDRGLPVLYLRPNQ